MAKVCNYKNPVRMLMHHAEKKIIKVMEILVFPSNESIRSFS